MHVLIREVVYSHDVMCIKLAYMLTLMFTLVSYLPQTITCIGILTIDPDVECTTCTEMNFLDSYNSLVQNYSVY